MKSILTRFAVFVAVLVLASCQKDSSADGELSYNFKTTNLGASIGSTEASSGQAVAAGSNGSITWTSATINIAKIELSAKKNNTEASFEVKDLFGIDLLKPGSAAGKIIVPAGSYDAVKLKISFVESATNIPLVLKGVYTEVSGTTIPVEFRFNSFSTIVVEGQHFVVNGDKYIADINLEMNNLVKGMVASNFGQTTRTNGVILITGSTNSTTYNKLKSNFEAMIKALIRK